MRPLRDKAIPDRNPHLLRTAGTSGQWVRAASVSLVAHGALVGWMLGLYPTLPQASPPIATIQVTSTPVTSLSPTDIGARQIPVITADDASLSTRIDNPGPAPAANPVLLPAIPDTARHQGEFLLTDRGRPASDLARDSITSRPDAPNLAATDAPPRIPGIPEDSRADNPSPLLLALIEAVQARIAEPCLLALPQADEAGTVRLTVISADERQSADFLREVHEATDRATFDEAQLLLDRRQCPAATWLRGAAGYPGFSLNFQLERANLLSGDSLRGTLTGMAGRYTNLLLIDDNGVVQDLRRFMLSSSGMISFDIPVTRAGNPRDTGQLLIAIATRDRISGLADLLGQRAEDVFPILGTMAQPDMRIGVAPFFVQ